MIQIDYSYSNTFILIVLLYELLRSLDNFKLSPPSPLKYKNDKTWTELYYFMEVLRII